MQGLVVVSGLAKGIDSIAHIGTMEANGATIAILGSGFNHIFPEENIELYKNIIKKGGLIISEYPPEIEPKSELFLERNRIVSGLSIGVLVVEAAYRSGTSVTAKLAKSQKKKVFVLPHEIDDKYGVGTNRLIKKGAISVTSTKDIIEEYDFLDFKYIELAQNIKQNFEVNIKDKVEKEIYILIKNGIKEVSEIARKSNKPINEITNILFMLELEGYIKKTVGGYKCI